MTHVERAALSGIATPSVPSAQSKPGNRAVSLGDVALDLSGLSGNAHASEPTQLPLAPLPTSDFPLTYRVGQIKAMVYKTPSNGSDLFTVAWYEGPTRKRKYFADPVLAWEHAQRMVNSVAKGEIKEVRLSAQACLSYHRAAEVAAEFGIDVDSMVTEFRDAKRLARKRSLVEMMRYVGKHGLDDIKPMTLQEVYDEMIKAKEDEGLSERYVDDLRSRLTMFLKEGRGKMEISNLRAPMIREWIQDREGVTNRTRNNFRLAIQTLCSFAKSQRYLARDWNEMELVPLWKQKVEEVEIFTAEEMITLLGVADDSMIPFLAIGAFAGLRSAEIERLDWAKVNLKTGYITVDASIAKTNSRRLVPITKNLKLWLTDHHKKTGPVVELANVPNAIQRLVEATKPPVDPDEPDDEREPAVAWKHNALRHSFCSYRLAAVKSAAQVALEAGNSPQMIFKHYRELVTEKQAKDWFAITPTVVEVTKAEEQREGA